jgi:hypothetical protein
MPFVSDYLIGIDIPMANLFSAMVTKALDHTTTTFPFSFASNLAIFQMADEDQHCANFPLSDQQVYFSKSLVTFQLHFYEPER